MNNRFNYSCAFSSTIKILWPVPF